MSVLTQPNPGTRLPSMITRRSYAFFFITFPETGRGWRRLRS